MPGTEPLWLALPCPACFGETLPRVALLAETISALDSWTSSIFRMVPSEDPVMLSALEVPTSSILCRGPSEGPEKPSTKAELAGLASTPPCRICSRSRSTALVESTCCFW